MYFIYSRGTYTIFNEYQGENHVSVQKFLTLSPEKKKKQSTLSNMTDL